MSLRRNCSSNTYQKRWFIFLFWVQAVLQRLLVLAWCLEAALNGANETIKNEIQPGVPAYKA